MIDTHCHLLWGVDDGPRTPAQALALGREHVQAGVDRVVCTPHFSRRFRTPVRRAEEARTALAQMFDELGVPLQLELAAELEPGLAVEVAMGELDARALGSGHLLVELKPDTSVRALDLIVERVGDAGLTPVFAHPERCAGVRAHPQALDEARSAGALAQVVAPSLLGRWGQEVARFAWHLVGTGRADALASDSHRAHTSGSPIAEAAGLVRDRFGTRALRALVEDGPRRMIGRL